MATRMQQRRGTAAEWAALNPVLADGEIGVESDTGVMKIGNGVQPWATLASPYIRGSEKLTTKGDMFVSEGNSVVRRLAAGSDGQFLRSDPAAPLGVRWGGGPQETVSEWFLSSTTWEKPEGAKVIEVIVIGAGGGGAASISTASINVSGGAGGGYGHWAFPADAIEDTVNIAVGAPGQPGYYGQQAALAGGASGFGPFIVTGGAGGVVSASGVAIGGRPNGSAQLSNNYEANPFAGGLATAGQPGSTSAYGGGGGGGVTNPSSGNVTARAGGFAPGGNDQLGYGFGGKGGNAKAVNTAVNTFGDSGLIPGGGGGAAVAAPGAIIVGGGGAPGVVIVIVHF